MRKGEPALIFGTVLHTFGAAPRANYGYFVEKHWRKVMNTGKRMMYRGRNGFIVIDYGGKIKAGGNLASSCPDFSLECCLLPCEFIHSVDAHWAQLG